MGRFRNWIIGAAVFFILFTAIGFLVVPPILKAYLLENLSKTLNRKVSIQSIGLNPYTLTLSPRGIGIKEPKSEADFVSLDKLALNLSIRTVFRRAPVIEELTLRKAYVHLVRNRDNTYNFSDLLALMKEEPKDKKKTPLLFSVNNIVVENGSVDFIDSPFDTTHTVRDLNIAILFLSKIPEYVNTYVQPRFEAVVNGDPYTIEGKTKIFQDSRETVFNILIEDFDIPIYLAYIPHELNISAPTGKLDAQSAVTFSMTPGQQPAISVAGAVALRDFALQDRKKNAFAGFKRLDAVMTSLEPLSSKFHFAKIAIDSPELNVRRDKSGMIKLLALGPPRKEDATPAGPESGTGEKPLPELILDDFDLKGGRLLYRDEAPRRPIEARIDNLSVKEERMSTVQDSQGMLAVSMDLNAGKGSLSLNGPVGNIEIGRISIQNGAVAFEDRHIKPNYLSTLTELTGRLTGVTAITTQPADVDIRGKIGRRLPMEITGKIHPFKTNLFVDIKASLKDFTVSPLTPYSGTYAGYKIEKGSLLRPEVPDRREKAGHGQQGRHQPAHPGRTDGKPPGHQAARGSEGKINLDIPVTGRIDDPEFSVWRIVWQVIVNLLTKVATAPLPCWGRCSAPARS